MERKLLCIHWVRMIKLCDGVYCLPSFQVPMPMRFLHRNRSIRTESISLLVLTVYRNEMGHRKTKREREKQKAYKTQCKLTLFLPFTSKERNKFVNESEELSGDRCDEEQEKQIFSFSISGVAADVNNFTIN